MSLKPFVKGYWDKSPGISLKYQPEASGDRHKLNNEEIMRHWTRLTLILLFFCNLAQAKDLIYYVDYGRFYDREGNPYLEVYINFEGMSLEYNKTDEGDFAGGVNMGLAFQDKAAPEGEYAYEVNVELLSPTIPDTSLETMTYGFMDVRRISLPPGEYEIIGTMRDINRADKREYKFVSEIVMEPQPQEILSFSDIEFISNFKRSEAKLPYSKHGYDIIPYITNGTYADQKTLSFFLEVYNSDKEAEDVYFANAYLHPANSAKKLSAYQKTLRKTPKGLDLINYTFNIENLPSQTYYLTVDLYNKKQELIGTQNRKFFVYNTRISAAEGAFAGDFDQYFDLEEKDLDYYIPTLVFGATRTETDFAKALKTEEEKKNFFYNYWDRRRKKDEDHIAKAWEQHEAMVKYANKKFKNGFRDGWKSDRGRILLTYGTPNDVEYFMSDNSKYPHEIWSYNRINTQSNVIFVFFDDDLATGEYPLLHSNRLGELNNPRWRLDLVRRNVGESNLDVNEPR